MENKIKTIQLEKKDKIKNLLCNSRTSNFSIFLPYFSIYTHFNSFEEVQLNIFFNFSFF